jgi:pimeloyl-ACP methyl ester carboxylesterase
MYVEYWVPQDLRHPLPVVMIHGGGGQGTDYFGTADGREGWAQWFVRQGYAVYVVDRPCHGRSPFQPELQGAMSPPMPTGFLEKLFSRPEEFPDNWPQAMLHDKWPSGNAFGTPEFDSFLAGMGPTLVDIERNHLDCQNAGAELLDKIGPAIIMTHSAGGPMGWMVADARPGLVKAVIAVEPVGPPFSERAGGRLSWGITGAKLSFDPPAETADDLEIEERAPAPNFRAIPIVVVTAEASWMTTDNHGTVDFLAQAGATVEHMRLEEHGIHGNGHMVMAETNSDEVAACIESWIAGRGLA